MLTGSIPPTGLPLPFISAGSTSLLVFMSAIGVVLNVDKQNKDSWGPHKTNVLKGKGKTEQYASICVKQISKRESFDAMSVIGVVLNVDRQSRKSKI